MKKTASQPEVKPAPAPPPLVAEDILFLVECVGYVNGQKEFFARADALDFDRKQAAVLPKLNVLYRRLAAGQFNNAIHAIMPYRWNGLWVFDDATTGLSKEAFVSGVDNILDAVTAKIPDAEHGFICLFSDKPFPGATIELTWLRSDEGGWGNWYLCEQLKIEGWFCPALLRYFAEPPKKIYGAFQPRGGNIKTTKTKHQSKL